MVVNGQNIRDTSLYNAIQFNTTANYNLNNKYIVTQMPLWHCQSNLNINIFVKADLLHQT